MLAGLLVAVVAFGLVGCDGKPRPPKTASKKTDKPAPPKEEPKPAEPPTAPEPPAEAKPADAAKPTVVVFAPPIIREKVAAARTAGGQVALKLPAIRSSKPHGSKDQALADALGVARIELMKQLEALDPPIHARPSMATMKNEYVKGDVRELPLSEDEKNLVKSSKLNPNVRYVEIDLELTEHQVQQLRATERVTIGFRVGGVLFALVAAAYAFLRLDQWTKGYLTTWLGIGAAAVVLVVALAVFA
jgi:hypothetical protein